MKHIYDWLDEMPKDEDEKIAKYFLNEATKPAIEKNYEWLAKTRLTCLYNGRRYRCTGASRMGDVMITKDWTQVDGYQKRVCVTTLSCWKLKESQKLG